MAEAMIEWGRTLQSFSPEDISKALDAMKREYLKFPPSLPQFLGLVKSQTAIGAYKQFPELPQPKMSREEQKEEAGIAIEVMRKILNEQDPPPDRQSPEYITWANYHRGVVGMAKIKKVNPDGSFQLYGH